MKSSGRARKIAEANAGWLQRKEALREGERAMEVLPVAKPAQWDPLRGDPRFEKIVASLAPKE